MKILCLYNNECARPLFEWLRREGHEVVLHTERLTEDWCRRQNFDLAVSYTYRFLLPENILHALHDNAVNLHNSYLPWNRGSDPNLWSIVENTPRGVTLHYMEAGLDKGAVIAQRLVPLLPDDTLKSSYDRLDIAAREQFCQAFQWYSYWPQMRKRPAGEGTYHSKKDGEFLHGIIRSYNMPAEEFRMRALQG